MSEIKVGFKTTKGRKDTVTISSEATILEFKEKIAEKMTDAPVANQRLIFKGRVLKDGDKLSKHNIVEDCTVIVIVKAPKPKKN